MITIGVSLNSRIVALAIIRKNILLDYKVRLYKKQWSTSKVNDMIALFRSCSKEYSIKKITVTIPHSHHTNKRIQTLIKTIRNFCHQKQISFLPCYQVAFDKFLQKERARKKALMLKMVKHYPELAPIYKKEIRNKNKYYYKLFEAVAAATIITEVHRV